MDKHVKSMHPPKKLSAEVKKKKNYQTEAEKKIVQCKFQCEHCDFGTELERNLDNHMLEKHLPEFHSQIEKLAASKTKNQTKNAEKISTGLS